jgi:uncharacterized protein involved in oxidation of intracellular sulfur
MASHVLILSTGREDGGRRAALAFGIATAALSVGDDATVYLADRGICWAYQPCIDCSTSDGETSMRERVALFNELGGRMLVCSRCVGDKCLNGVCLSDSDLVAGAEFGGFTTLVELVSGATVYTF